MLVYWFECFPERREFRWVNVDRHVERDASEACHIANEKCVRVMNGRDIRQSSQWIRSVFIFRE